MKKIFLSLPMSGRTNADIETEISYMKTVFLLKYSDDKEEIQFIDNHNCIVPAEEITKSTCSSLLYLGEAIKKMADCDIFVLSANYKIAKGCLIEAEVADLYGIPSYKIVHDSIEKL